MFKRLSTTILLRIYARNMNYYARMSKIQTSYLNRETNTSIHRIHQATPDQNFQTVRLPKPAKRRSIAFNQL